MSLLRKRNVWIALSLASIGVLAGSILIYFHRIDIRSTRAFQRRQSLAISRSQPTNDTTSPYEKMAKDVIVDSKVIGRLSRTIFGFYPHWMSDQEIPIRFDYLTHIAYFSYEIDPASGAPATIHDWLTTPIIEQAHHSNTKVILVATLFGSEENRIFLSQPRARSTCIDSLVSLVAQRGADGINLDLELVPRSLRDSLTQFVRDVAAVLRSKLPGAHLSLDVPAIDHNGSFDVAALSSLCDNLILMGYDYHYSKSEIAGPVAPLITREPWSDESIAASLDAYRLDGATTEKILLGVPWYGYEWATRADSLASRSISTGKVRFYSSVARDERFTSRRFDSASGTAWLVTHNASVTRQTWFDDSLTLALKYGHVDSIGLGGIAIWALGYEGNREEIWDGIANAFVRVERIDFEHPISADVEKWWTINQSRGQRTVARYALFGSNHFLDIRTTDSSHSAQDWFIPIELPQVLVLPRSGVITMNVYAPSVPANIKMICELALGSKRIATEPVILTHSKGWLPISFNIPPTETQSGDHAQVLPALTLNRVCITAPGNSRAAHLMIDDITPHACLLPRESLVESVELDSNRVGIRAALSGMEMTRFELRRYDAGSQLWSKLTDGRLRRKQTLDTTWEHRLDRAAIYTYQLLVTDRRNHALTLAQWTIDYTPSITDVVWFGSDSMRIRIQAPKSTRCLLQVSSSLGLPISNSLLRTLTPGENTVTMTFMKTNRALRGIFFVRLRSAELAKTVKLLRL